MALTLETLDIDGNPGATRSGPGERDWVPGISRIALETLDYGGSRAQLTLTFGDFDNGAPVDVSAEMTFGDVVAMRRWCTARIRECRENGDREAR